MIRRIQLFSISSIYFHLNSDHIYAYLKRKDIHFHVVLCLLIYVIIVSDIGCVLFMQFPTIWVMSSLVPIVGGVALASLTEASFNWWGIQMFYVK